jgi:hypothetical protein
MSYSTALALLDLGFDIAVLGFALALLTAVSALTRNGMIT